MKEDVDGFLLYLKITHKNMKIFKRVCLRANIEITEDLDIHFFRAFGKLLSEVEDLE